MNKPKKLFHGSGTNNLTILEPRAINTRKKQEGEVVFAAQDFALACMFMSPRADDSWKRLWRIDTTYYIVFSDEQRFRENDKGGSVYEVPLEKFELIQESNDTEWVSKSSVKVLKEYCFDSTLKALIDNNVQVYFVDKELFEEIKNMEWKKRMEIVLTLEKTLL
jgi:hypothetical protein